MTFYKSDLIEKLALKSIENLGASKGDIEKICWMVVHEYHHGVKPVEYDIREIDETLYLSVLDSTKEKLAN